MDRRNDFPRAKVKGKLASSARFKPLYRQELESDLSRSLSKLEHRAEILIAISRDQRVSECYELAEAYRKQSMHWKARAESIRKLLDLA